MQMKWIKKRKEKITVNKCRRRRKKGVKIIERSRKDRPGKEGRKKGKEREGRHEQMERRGKKAQGRRIEEERKGEKMENGGKE